MRSVTRLSAVLFATLFLFASAWAQIPALLEVPEDAVEPDRTTLRQDRRNLHTRLAGLRQRAQAFNAACGSVEKDSADAQRCRQQYAELDALRSAYIADAGAFNARIRQVVATRVREIEIERKRFRDNRDEWLKEKEQLVREAVAASTHWTKEVLSALRDARSPTPDHRPTYLSDLKPGDILLVAPPSSITDDGGIFSRLVTVADQFYTGRAFRTGQVTSPASHALTFIGRAAGGQMLFLDNTPGRGSHIIGETEFRQDYTHRSLFVAKPQAVVDGRKILSVALDAAHNARKHGLDTNYGVFGKDVVCSERAALAVAKASNREDIYNHHKRLGVVDITPADFFDDQHVGKYFVISPITEAGVKGPR